jgi:hypothetical protein
MPTPWSAGVPGSVAHSLKAQARSVNANVEWLVICESLNG